MGTFEVMRIELIESVKNSFEKNNIDILRKKYDTYKVNENDKRSSLDQVLRDYLLQLLAEPCDNVSMWETYVTFCIDACRQDMCTPTMPVVLLGDIFDALTLDCCETLFAFVENGVNTWREEMFFSACKNNLLRMCNDLLRRLSRSQNTVFCGRILLFLAKFFPFSERSGLNIVSEFNLDNLTEFGGESSNDLKDILVEKDEAMEEDLKPDAKIKIDYNLYCKFWALQDFFRNPNQCYSKVHWKTFSAHSSNVLLAFKSFKLDDMQGKRRKLDISDEDRQQQQQQQHYFAKFLTNQKLLELQLSDANFRRYVLLQFLIVFQYLNSPVKFKSETHELKVDQSDWVREKTEMVYSLLEETPPDGIAFVQTVKHILKREEHWNSWKNDGCPEFQKPAHQVTADETTEEGGEKRKTLPRPRRPKKSLGDQMKDVTQHGKFIMGNMELTKLWNLCPNNLEACKSKDRDFLPSLEGYFEEAIEQIDPAAMVEEEYKRVNDGNFGWRALRLLARRSPHFFTHSNNPINKLPEYLETMIKKIAKDRPSMLSNEEVKSELMDNDVQTVVPDAEAEDDELLKSEEKEERTMPPQEYEDEGMGTEKGDSKRTVLLKAHLEAVAVKVAPHWQKLAAKLGYQADEVDFFENEDKTKEEQALNMLQIWAEDDEDASPENLSYTLEGLGLLEAAEVLKEVTEPMSVE